MIRDSIFVVKKDLFKLAMPCGFDLRRKINRKYGRIGMKVKKTMLPTVKWFFGFRLFSFFKLKIFVVHKDPEFGHLPLVTTDS